jgi:hypothetical protein
MDEASISPSATSAAINLPKRASMSGLRSMSGLSRSPARASLEETMFAAPAPSPRHLSASQSTPPTITISSSTAAPPPSASGSSAAPQQKKEKKEKSAGANPKENQPPPGAPAKKSLKEMTKAERRELQVNYFEATDQTYFVVNHGRY